MSVPGFRPDGSRVPYQILRGGAIGLRLRDSVDDLHIPLVPGQPDDGP